MARVAGLHQRILGKQESTFTKRHFRYVPNTKYVYNNLSPICYSTLVQFCLVLDVHLDLCVLDLFL